MRKYKNTQTLLKNYEFSNVFNSGAYYSGKFIYVFIKRNGLKYNRVGFSVSKKRRNAILMNRGKRLLRQNFLDNIDKFKSLGFDIVFGIKKTVDIKLLKYDDVSKDFFKIFNKLDYSKIKFRNKRSPKT